MTDHITVQWKDEDEEDGVPIGPVWINDVPREWLTKPQALALAKELGTTLEVV